MHYSNLVKQQSFLKQRQNDLAGQLEKRNLDAFLVSSEKSRYYLTGWQGDSESGFCLITKKENYYVTDSRYTELVTNTTDFNLIESNSGTDLSLADLIKKMKLTRIGFESHDLSVFASTKIKKSLKKVRFIPVDHLIESVRAVKDKKEISYIQKASDIADKAFRHIKTFIRSGIKEVEVAWELERYMREQGAESVAWSPLIVATGKNSSVAHWGASSTKIKKADMIQLDFGCSYKGYVCDISRVVFVGEPNNKQKEIYDLVFEAQKLGLSMVKEGIDGGVIDKKVKEFLKNKTKHCYKHSLGHGVGLDVHELPFVSASRKNKLEAGNVITIEPGIYIPGWGGVRIEDTILVTKIGYSLLTKSSRNLNDSLV